MSIFFYWQQFFVSALMFLATCNVSAQQTTLSKETEVQPNLIYLKPVENEKLQQYTLNKIFLSKTGKLYLGTNSGLVCYDGLSVKTYSHIDGDTNSLSQNNIVDIVEDKKGNLYLSTKSGGINYLNLKTGKTRHLSISSDILVSLLGTELLESNLYLDDDDNLWIGPGNGGLYFYNCKSNRYRLIRFDDINNNPFGVFDIKQDPKKKDILWLGTTMGILSINKETFQVSNKFRKSPKSDSIPERQARVTSLDVRQDGIIWFVTEGFGIGKYDATTGLYNLFAAAYSPLIRKNDITALFKKNNNEYYITLRNGSIYIYNIVKNGYTFLPEQFLPKKPKESKEIIVDGYGNTWCVINGRLFVSYSEKNLFKTIAIKDKIYKRDSIPNELQNIIWDSAKKQYYMAFSNSDEGLFIFNDSLKLIKSIITIPGNGPEQNGVYNIALDSKGRLWGNQWNYLSVYDSNVGITGISDKYDYVKYSKYNLSKEKMFPIYLKYPSLRNLWPAYQHGRRTLDILSDKETIYTLNGDSCFAINATSLIFKSIPFNLIDTISRSPFMGVRLRVDKKNNFIYACNYSYDSSNSIIIQYDLNKRSLKKLFISSSLKVPIYYAQFPWYELDDSGNIWVATSQSVLVYEPKTFNRIHVYEKKNSVGIKQLINITDKGVMCIMSESGVELYDYINDRSINMSVSDGLYANSFRIGAYANKKLFISYPGYLQYVPIDSFLNKRENRNCYLSEFFISGKENRLFPGPEFLKNIKLKYYQHDITLTVSTTEFNLPKQLQYRYMLEGADKEWSYSDFENRSITYRNLSPGTYLYKAAIKNSDGSWSNNELKLAIIIQPAFWQTSWFKFLCVVFILGLVYLFNHRRIKKIRSQEKQRLIHEKELIELEAKALRAQMNPHFIFNCLNSIKSLIQDDQKDKSVTYLTTFSKLIRTLFNNADKKEISLFDEIETCKLYLQLEAMRFDAKFSYTVNVDDGLDLKSILVPALIIQPFIENAIWHGIVPKGGGGNVSLIVLKNNGAVEIIIDDDGIGREASRLNKAASNIGHQSKGVNLTQSRLELDNLLQQRQAVLETVDKKDADGKTAGTKVTIKISQEE